MNEFGTIISEIIRTNLPLALAIFSVILTGNVVRVVLYAKDVFDKKSMKFSLDVLSIVFGIGINFVTFYLNKINSLDFSKYLIWSTWFYLSIVTLVLSVFAWRYRIHGKKFINDTITTIFGIIIGILMLTGAFNIGKMVVDFGSISLCQTTTCNVIEISKKIFSTIFGIFLLYYGYKILKISIKEKRYRKIKK